MKQCTMCKKMFPAAELDFLEHCEPCFRIYVNSRPPDQPLLFQRTGNRHYPKETKARLERLQRKISTSQGVDHNYVKRTYV